MSDFRTLKRLQWHNIAQGDKEATRFLEELPGRINAVEEAISGGSDSGYVIIDGGSASSSYVSVIDGGGA